MSFCVISLKIIGIYIACGLRFNYHSLNASNSSLQRLVHTSPLNSAPGLQQRTSYGPWSQSCAILCPPESVLEVLRDRRRRRREEQGLALEVAVVHLMERRIRLREVAVVVVEEEHLAHLNQEQVVAALEVEERNQRPPELEAHLGPEFLVCYP